MHSQVRMKYLLSQLKKMLVCCNASYIFILYKSLHEGQYPSLLNCSLINLFQNKKQKHFKRQLLTSFFSSFILKNTENIFLILDEIRFFFIATGCSFRKFFLEWASNNRYTMHPYWNVDAVLLDQTDLTVFNTSKHQSTLY